MLSRKQMRFLSDDLPRMTIVEGCISSGKTWVCNHKAVEHIITNYKGAGLIFFIGRTLTTLERNVLEPLALTYKRKFSYSTAQKRASLCDIRIDLEGCNDLSAESKIRGSTAEFIYGDELTLWNLPFLNRCMGSLRTPDACFLGTTNPDNPYNFIKTNYLDRQEELGLRRVRFEMDDNPTLTEAYKEQVSREYTGVFHDRFIKGLWVRAEGIIYPMFQPDRHVTDDLPRIHSIGFAVDVGHSNATVFLAIGEGEDGRAYVLEEYYHSGHESRVTLSPAAYAREFIRFRDDMFSRFPYAEQDLTYIDPSALGFKAQLVEAGETYTRAAYNDVVPGIQTVASVIDNDLLRVSPRCDSLIREFAAYVWDEKAAARGEDKPVKEDDHALDALRYYFASQRNAWTSRRV